jgi:hypothetical protein
VKTEAPRLRAGRLIAAAARDILRPPFRTIVALSVLIEIVVGTFGNTLGDDTAFTLAVLISIDIYLQLALTLAAASPDPEPTSDGWIKGAFRRRCFLRYLFAELSAVLIVVLAAVGGLIAGGVIAAGWLALAQPAAALERRMPIDALRRSIELARPAVLALAIVFTLTIGFPAIGAEVGTTFGWDDKLGVVWTILVSFGALVTGIGTVALSRAFVALGGTPAPPLAEIDPWAKRR